MIPVSVHRTAFPTGICSGPILLVLWSISDKRAI